jgi:DNA repair exonuclease SbcCD nuclease subunit|tara:strand:- start:3174 stop:4238 length:1065 start_codon:yes stop_codon:yes gene_type:complete
LKAAIITDTHFGARNDSQIYIKYFEKFYNDIFFPYLTDNNITTVFHLGDIVDRRKYISYVTLREFKRIFVQPCIDNKINLVGIVGNHDIPYRNTNEVNAMNELFKETNITFHADPVDYTFDDCSIALLPWISNGNYGESMEFIKNTKSQVLFGHLELRGFDMYRGMPNPHGLESALFDKFDLVCSGHFHTKSSKGNIHYLGNPYEMFWNDYNDQRGFHVFDSTKRELTFIQNPYRIFNKIWYDDIDVKLEDLLEKYNFDEYKDTYVKVIIQNKNNPYWFDIVMDNLYKADPAHISIVDDHKNLDQQTEEEIISEAEDTLTSLYKYVDQMDTRVDKAKLNQLFANLYTEAQNMEL